ncbi:MAG: Gfo/Idh/MocA family oxidoreductase [Planctomycetes bacterium]|nr:Gfo/Idh/MocA family oxidoreductase [Planctomycetota bacterium]
MKKQNRKRSSMSRRTLLARGLAASASLALPTLVSSRVVGTRGLPGANDRLRVAAVGMGRRGQNLIGNLPPEGRVVAICDCAQSRLAGTYRPKGKFVPILAPFLASADSKTCKRYQDARQLFDREKLDAVMISTPDHNHAFIAMLALQAGLDVYLEKPLTLTIAEGRALSDAVQRTGCVLQVGSQNRTMEMNRFACQFIRDGGIGKISHVDVPNYAGPLHPRSLEEEPIPDGLDWNLFCGPSPLRSYHRHRWVKDEYKVGDLRWRGWDLWRDYSGHLTTNWGAHSLDIVQHALGRDLSGPVEVILRPVDDVLPLAKTYAATTPMPRTFGSNADDDRRFWPVTLRYDDGIEIRFNPTVNDWQFHGKNGTLMMHRNRFRTDPPDLVKDGPDPQVAEKWKGFGHVCRPHVANWIDCIKTRATPNAPVEIGHRSNSVCLLANLARELGRSLRWNPETERFVDDQDADRRLDRPRRKGFELPVL